MGKPVIIWGVRGVCMIALDILQKNGMIVYGFLDDDQALRGAGSVVGAEAKLNERVFVGAGAHVVAGVEIGAAESIGEGMVVLANVKSGKAILGNPAMPIKV